MEFSPFLKSPDSPVKKGQSSCKHRYAGAIRLLSILSLILIALPAGAYYFQGYYVPQVLVSPMRDDIAYTPAGAGVVSSKAGYRVHPVTGQVGSFHNGVDLAANLNDKVYCLLDGLVTRVGYRGNLGVAVEIYHPYPNVRTICGHMNAYSVQPGQWVQRGRVIGYAGSTGRSTGVHVHYTVVQQDTGQYIDPMAFIRQVPQYVVALKSARVRAAALKNVETFKKSPQKHTNDEDDAHSDEPEKPGEHSADAPPDAPTDAAADAGP